MYSVPGLFVHTFLQVTEQVWHPMHLSRFRTIVIWARIFMVSAPSQNRRLTVFLDDALGQYISFAAASSSSQSTESTL